MPSSHSAESIIARLRELYERLNPSKEQQGDFEDVIVALETLLKNL